jgi:hypothetical protein
MSRSAYPPSLRVTPELITAYLAAHDIACNQCGYSLRGLRAPRCPECGAWTEVSQLVFAHAVRGIEHKLGAWGIVDDRLIKLVKGRVEALIPLNDVVDVRVFDWRDSWSRRLLFSLCMTIGFLNLIAVAGIGAYAAIGMKHHGWGVLTCIGLVLLAFTGFVCCFVMIRNHVDVVLIEGVRRIDCSEYGGDEIKEVADGWRSAIAQSSDTCGPDAAGDAAADLEAVEVGLCPYCGYPLEGPPLRMLEKAPEGEGCGVSLLLVGFFIGPAMFVTLFATSSASSAVERGVIIAGSIFSLGLLMLGFKLRRRRRWRRAVPDWPGSGSCAACGWRPSKPPARGEAERN